LAGAPRDAFAATAAEAAATATQGDVVDLRSDTVTKPTPGMLQAMVRADVGDDVYGEDPSVNTLQEYAASLLGTQDALWVPTGTMANIVSVLANCRRGEQVILGSASHVWLWEQHGLSSLGGLALHPLPNDPRTGELHIPDIIGAIHPLDDHLPISRMVVLENSQSGCGGVALTPSYTKEVADMCKAHGLHLHIDGARLLNAAVALDVPPSDLTEGATSVSVCLRSALPPPTPIFPASSRTAACVSFLLIIFRVCTLAREWGHRWAA
jgi:threonine aldolase